MPLGKQKGGNIKLDIERAKRALNAFVKGTEPLFGRVAEDFDKRAEKVLDGIAVELAANGMLEFFMTSIDNIAKAHNFKNCEHFISDCGQYEGIKERLKHYEREAREKAKSPKAGK